MKKILLIAGLAFFTIRTDAQNNVRIVDSSDRKSAKIHTNYRQAAARSMGNRLADSLKLAPQQKSEIIRINLSLEEQNTEVIRKYSKERALLWRELRKIEESRNKLYEAVLTEAQFNAYKSKKAALMYAAKQ